MTWKLVWCFSVGFVAELSVGHCCFRMAGVFDIDLETEDVSDAEVCIPQLLNKPAADRLVNLNLFESLQDDVCDFTVTEPEK